MFNLHVVLSESERDHLKAQVEQAGVTERYFVRQLIMGEEIRPKPPEVYAELLRQMAAIGNNINQIAKVANGTGRVRREDIQSIQEMQGRLWRQVKAL